MHPPYIHFLNSKRTANFENGHPQEPAHLGVVRGIRVSGAAPKLSGLAGATSPHVQRMRQPQMQPPQMQQQQQQQHMRQLHHMQQQQMHR